jgi:hypothetical protein
MKFVRRNSLAIILLAGLLLCQRGSVGAQMQQTDDHSHMAIDESGGAAGEPAEVQMERAIAAGPRHVTDFARIVGTDAQGKRVVLREGSSGFTCQPGNPKVLGRPASCSNEAARQWSADMAAHKAKPTNAEPGIVYMLAGATRGSVSDPSDKTSPPLAVGPQWMIMWPFDPKTTGLSITSKDTGAYIKLAGTPYAHLHIMGQPVGTPMEHLAVNMKDDGAPWSVEPSEIQMARAIAAGPKEITDQARIMGSMRKATGLFCAKATATSFASLASPNSLPNPPRVTRRTQSPASLTCLQARPSAAYPIATTRPALPSQSVHIG